MVSGHWHWNGAKLIEAFDREFVLRGVAAQEGRERAMLTGSCEVRESPEQASVLAALDATNRWIAHAALVVLKRHVEASGGATSKWPRLLLGLPLPSSSEIRAGDVHSCSGYALALSLQAPLALVLH